jgi:hypothetical protein
MFLFREGGGEMKPNPMGRCVLDLKMKRKGKERKG